MVRTAVDPLVHDLAVVEALEGIDGGHPVGYGAAPDGALADLMGAGGPDYLIVYPLPGGWRDGPMGDPYADVELAYQVTCVGALAAGVRHLVSRIESALVDLVVEGREVVQVTPDDMGAVRLDPDVKPDRAGAGVFIATPRFRIVTTPAT